ncbi:hypothetical protein [Nocardiopsis trehalosi]|jgi:hypothetical protein|uniref:hypothetical protein n=1 Tax=Nocardiopsis trehalosi TaxID=109329 RepID=UPI00082C4052|nr:hypothetical protein [Nocardiopsis trehalosi]
MLTSSPRARFEAATDVLAADLARALTETGRPFSLERHVVAIDDSGSGLGAVRVLGADVLTPFLLTGRSPDDDDVAVVRAAVRAFPAPPSAPAVDPVWSARDWALSRALVRCGADPTGWEGLTPDPADPGPEAAPDPDGRGAAPWPGCSVALARLASLALPGLDGPTRTTARTRRDDAARGMARSLLRRDHLTAARLARWLALDDSAAPEPLLESAVAHLELLGVGEPRTALELSITRRIMEPER